MDWFDAYERRARLAPGLLMLLAPAITGIALGARDWPVVSGLIGILGLVGAPLVLTAWVREQGVAVQETLWTRWGGRPTAVALKEDTGVAARRRERLSKLTGIQLTLASPDEDWDQALGMLRRSVDDPTKYRLVFEENRNYGFERNLLGVSRAGALLAGGCLIVLGVVSILASKDFAGISPTWQQIAIAAAFVLILLFSWLTFPSEERVKLASARYGDRLLETLDILPLPGGK